MEQDSREETIQERKFFKSFDNDLNKRIEAVKRFSFFEEDESSLVHEKHCGFCRNGLSNQSAEICR